MVFASKFVWLFCTNIRYAMKETRPKALTTRIVTTSFFFLISHLSNCMNLFGVRLHAIFHSFSFGRPENVKR